MQANSLADHASAEKVLGQAVTGLFGIAEAYPDLKANANFIELQRELSDTENKIQAARRFYNGTVKDFNTRVQSVPSNIVAKLFGFKNAEFFDLADNDVAQQPVEVKF
jgi:LemA protein